jgi:hypothetical protein
MNTPKQKPMTTAEVKARWAAATAKQAQSRAKCAEWLRSHGRTER